MTTAPTADPLPVGTRVLAEKVCSLGAHVAPVRAFHRNRAAPDGLCSACKDCQRARRRERAGITATRSRRRRQVVGGVPHISCCACRRLLPRDQFPSRRKDRLDPAAYCRDCGNARRQAAHARRLWREMEAPEVYGTRLRDQMAAAQRRRQERKAADRAEWVRDGLAVARVYIDRLRAAGWTWARIAAAGGVHPETVRRWADPADRRLPDRPPLARALLRWEAAVAVAVERRPGGGA
jgi:hypothetical protein